MYRFDDILSLLKANENIEIEKPIPACPKHADIDCARIAGNCRQGNNKQCEQEFVFYAGGSLHILKPKFVIENNTTSGFFKESDMRLNMLFNNGLITKPTPYTDS
jgi:hypothetical protein